MSFLELRKNLKKDFSAFATVKVAILADSASQLFAQAVRGYGYTQKINLDIWEADYDQIHQTVFDDSSKLYTYQPAYVIVFQSTKKLLASFYKSSNEGKKEFAINHTNYVAQLADRITSKFKCTIIYVNLPEINDSVFGNFANKTSYSFLYQVRLINVELMKLASEKKSFNICDLAAIQNTYGSNTTVSEKLYITADNVLEIETLPIVARNMVDIILAYTGKFKKCLILDLDNTMWGGIIGDDGLEGIQIGDLGIGKAFTKFQQWIKQLKERGIILAVCSKNTEHIAKEPFEKHPDMVLKLNDIAVFVANWNNKADNIRHIQSILNIGFDSMVFLDDNPAEREIVKNEIPEVTVPNLPEDPADYLSFLYQQNLFETTSFTEEDTKRNDQYRQEAERTIVQHQFTNEDDFLANLEMEAIVKPINKFTLPRAAQLTQRSNQFNLRTIRYDEAQINSIVEDATKFTITISLKDKFGDYGLISLLILQKNETAIFIDTWIMSCRVLKRNVEALVLNEIVDIARKNNCTTIIGEYIPTPKNDLVKGHYLNLGFQFADDNWILSTDKYTENKHFINKVQ